MKLAKSRLNTQRRHMENKLKLWAPMLKLAPPPSGWVKAIRESLGMTARQLGQFLGMSSPAVTKLESRERDRSVTLRDLDRAAEVLGCKVVYSLVPITTLEDTLNQRAKLTAQKLAQKAKHHMDLEAQGVDAKESKAQTDQLTKLLKETLDSRIWEKNLK